MLETQGIAPTPPPIAQWQTGVRLAKHYRSLALRERACRDAQIENTIGGNLYIGCADGNLVVLNERRGKQLASGRVVMDGVTAILPVTARAVAIYGFNSGASLRQELSILRVGTLKPIVRHPMTDSTFLGVIGDRAYIDDWCCFGRADAYRPATIYWVSLKDGAESAHINLAPDPEAHPGRLQPLGQGEHNYLIGEYFYVVVGPVTYRYDVRDFNKPPKRMATPSK